MQKITFFSLLIIFLSACGNPKAEKQTNTTPTKSLEICMDTLDDAKSWEYFTKGYRDTCYINGQHFAIRLIDTTDAEKNALLEKKVNDKWMIVDSFNYGQYRYNFTTDYNNDGFMDFVENQKWQDNVFLYDVKNKTFVRTGEFYTNSQDSSILINAERQLYADRWSYKFENGWSYLFTLKDLKRTNLAKMEYLSQNKNGELIENAKKRTIEVVKINTDGTYSKALEVLKNTKGLGENEYPYADYWSKNWQNFVR
jgi:hypothetical protein